MKQEHSILGVKHARGGRRESRRGKGRGEELGRMSERREKNGGKKMYRAHTYFGTYNK
jgi:hypothetical protein